MLGKPPCSEGTSSLLRVLTASAPLLNADSESVGAQSSLVGKRGNPSALLTPPVLHGWFSRVSVEGCGFISSTTWGMTMQECFLPPTGRGLSKAKVLSL